MDTVLSDVINNHDRMFIGLQKIETELVSILKDVKKIYDEKISVIKYHLHLFMKLYEEELLLHFKAEEEAIFPFADDKEIIDELIKEHEVIKEKVDQLKEMDIERNLNVAIKALKNIIEMLKDHAQMENELYARMEKKLTISQLNEIKNRIKKVYGM